MLHIVGNAVKIEVEKRRWGRWCQVAVTVKRAEGAGGIVPLEDVVIVLQTATRDDGETPDLAIAMTEVEGG